VPTATQQRPRGRFGSCLMTGLSVHLVAAIIFAVAYAMKVDGCDEGDSTMAALALAAGADVLIAAALVFLTRKRNRGAPIAATLGWVASFVPVAALFTVAVGYANSLGSGC
jgi:LPXTG-motif cell wall-anchored protein